MVISESEAQGAWRNGNRKTGAGRSHILRMCFRIDLLISQWR